MRLRVAVRLKKYMTAELIDNIQIDAWENSTLFSVDRYFFSEKEPDEEKWASHDLWWHFDKEGAVVEWVKK